MVTVEVFILMQFPAIRGISLTSIGYPIIDKNLPTSFIKALLTQPPLKFKVSWKDNIPNLNDVFEEDQSQLLKITRSFENLINQTDAIEAEKGMNTFGFGFPILKRGFLF